MDKTDFQEGKTTMCEIMERWKKELIADGQKTAFENGEKSSAIRILRILANPKARPSPI